MPNVKLRFACALYDRMLPLYTREVRPEGIDLEFIVSDDPRETFDRMVRDQAYDLSEMSSSEFVSRMARGQCPFVALPVFPSRLFRHSFIAINKRSGIRQPKDLEGRRVGVQLYTMTAAVFIRGLLQHEYGVDLSTIHWVQGAMDAPGAHGSPTVLPLLEPVDIEINRSNYSLSELLERGEIDAIIGATAPKSLGINPDIARLFPDYDRIEVEYYPENWNSTQSCIWWRFGATSMRRTRSLPRASTRHSATPRRWRWNRCVFPVRCATCCRG